MSGLEGSHPRRSGAQSQGQEQAEAQAEAPASHQQAGRLASSQVRERAPPIAAALWAVRPKSRTIGILIPAPNGSPAYTKAANIDYARHRRLRCGQWLRSSGLPDGPELDRSLFEFDLEGSPRPFHCNQRDLYRVKVPFNGN